jgi:sec-independent protein translocase protein TatC
MSAGIISIPFITYQLLMFIMPGLTDKEKRWVLMSIPFATGFFLLGVAFAWFVMLPTAFEFLYGFQDDVFSNEWTAQRYFAVLTSLLFWIGVAFEMPVILFLLAKVGLIGPRQLIQSWRFAVVAIAIIAAVITPTADPFNMLLVMAPLLVLYAISIVLVTFAARSRQQTDQKPI